MTDRDRIDKMIQWRKTNRAWDNSPIKVNLGPKELCDALRLPKPMLGQKYPKKVLYRGLELIAKEATW